MIYLIGYCSICYILLLPTLCFGLKELMYKRITVDDYFEIVVFWVLSPVMIPLYVWAMIQG